jgi:hypothetical protein
MRPHLFVHYLLVLRLKTVKIGNRYSGKVPKSVHLPKSVKVPIVGTFTRVPMGGIFTNLGIGTNTGTGNLQYR